MRWLHLSDLHVGLENESQELALMNIVDAIAERSKSKPFDLVLMTGDLAYSGKVAEYDRLKKLIVDPIRELPEFEHTRFIAVPGNHDVDCDIGYPPTVTALGRKKSEEFFHLNEKGKRLRQLRAESFSAYSKFLIDANIEGVNPVEEPACTIDAESSTVQLQLICVVTAFFSSKDLENEKHNVPAPIHPIRYLLTEGNQDPHRFILAHHPTDWFTPESQQQLDSLLVEHNVVYLHGHEHRIQANFGRRGLTSVGFGAVYQRSLEAESTPYYRNSFAICELDGSLHIDIRTWDPENGKWTNDTSLPANFDEESSLISGGRVLPLPTTLLKDYSTGSSRNAVSVLPMAPHLTGSYWFARDDRARWLSILREFGIIDTVGSVFKPPSQGLAEGHIELRVQQKDSHNLIHAISGHGDVMSYEQVVTLNTLLDTDVLSSCTIITLGDFSDQAKTLVNRLSSSKPIKAIDGKEFVRLWLTRSTSPLVALLKSLDVSSVSVTLVITDEDYALLLRDQLRNEWFQVIERKQRIVEEADPLIFDLRQAFPVLKSLAYRDASHGVVNSLDQITLFSETSLFDREKYLTDAHQVFDDVRYAPLAALGFRFKDTSLTDIYIQTSADIGSDSRATQTLQRAVSEYVESLNLDQALRDQLESQLRSRYGLGRSAEVGAARQLYRRYSNTIILGDPGSGKTCFVKYEILAYCRPPEDNKSWYEKHLPIYIPLSEAAELLRMEEDFFSACTVIAARRKLKLPEKVIVQYLSEGRAAFFFDGLDEVSRIEERVNLISIIDDLVSKYARYGNRFVLTSRPAAIRPVDIPEEFTYLHLKGLTEGEIRVLAERVLTTRLGTMEQEALTSVEKEVVDKLLRHVRNSPGLRRISRNPLLLTLLVLIYANTGSLSARRHVVYTQAVKTLVSFRHRETKEQVLPEADLRTRLGRLAYDIYQRKISELPSRSEVVDTLMEVIPTNSIAPNEKREQAETFLRMVAEATGLLVIHSREKNGTKSEDVVSFMHHSFLEYYAAVGFLSRTFQEEIPIYAAYPHWRDVITLMFGLWSEHHDITDLLVKLIKHETELESITNERLMLAFDCAFECDVPPQEAQNTIAENVRLSLSEGALKYSEYLREKIASSADQLIASAGVEVFDKIILNGINSDDHTTTAAFIDFIGHLKEPARFRSSIIEAFEHAFSTRNSTVVRSACAAAMMRRAELRTEKATLELRDCFQGNLVEKLTAIKAAEACRTLAGRFQAELIALLDDSSPLISSTAAQCILVTGLSQEDFRKKEIAVRKAVARWQASQQPVKAERISISLNGSYLRSLIESTKTSDVEFAARLLPLSNFNDKQVHRLLMETLREHKHHAVTRACLDALRMKEGPLSLITLAETDHICKLANSKFRDVRIGALRILGMLPNDEQVVTTILECCGMTKESKKKGRFPDQADEAYKALSKHARKDARLQQVLANAVLSALPEPGAQQFGDDTRQRQRRSILSACERVGAIVDEKLSNRLLDLVKDYRTPDSLRIQALKVYGRTVRPTASCVSELTTLLRRDDKVTNDACYTACYWFLGQCRKRVEYVRAVYNELPILRKMLIRAWIREKGRIRDRIDSVALGDIRRSLVELQNLLVSHEEFSERMKLSGKADYL